MKRPFDPIQVAKRVIAELPPSDLNHFIVSWEGPKFPSHAAIDGIIIERFRPNGQVESRANEKLGLYDFIQEWGGPQKRTHTILLITAGLTITPPHQGTVFLLEDAQRPNSQADASPRTLRRQHNTL